MKNLLIPAIMMGAISMNAQDLPQPSPLGKTEQVVGLTNVMVEYSRPSMKGRQIFGELVPFGKVWRTGANMNSIFSVDGPVMVEGKKLEAGQYSLFTIPNETEWEIIFNRNIKLSGEGDRKDEEDALRVKVPATKGETFETFTILFDNVKDDKAEMQLRWSGTLVKVNIHADATERGLASIKEALSKPDASFGAYHSSARFLLDRNLMPREALNYAEKSVAMEKKFWNLHTLALAYAKNGKISEAISTAQESMKLAEEAKYDTYVKMNKEKIAEWQKGTSAKTAN